MMKLTRKVHCYLVVCRHLFPDFVDLVDIRSDFKRSNLIRGFCKLNADCYGNGSNKATCPINKTSRQIKMFKLMQMNDVQQRTRHETFSLVTLSAKAYHHLQIKYGKEYLRR
ncbi:hypothetical protein ACOSQ4_006216 [Xanthoceras sorbifolium]